VSESLLLVTGANGHLGRRLCARIANGSNMWRVRALVRSERAAEQLRALPEAERPEIVVVDYTDADRIARPATAATPAFVSNARRPINSPSRFSMPSSSSSWPVANASSR
jgi:uncharacterized protein YbjT (DUF2867 family)